MWDSLVENMDAAADFAERICDHPTQIIPEIQHTNADICRINTKITISNRQRLTNSDQCDHLVHSTMTPIWPVVAVARARQWHRPMAAKLSVVIG